MLSFAVSLVQSLLNEDGDINHDLFNEPTVKRPANLLKLTTNEIHLSLLHADVKYSAVIPLNPRFQALPTQSGHSNFACQMGLRLTH